MIEVEVISEEIIKPSSPTPNHLKTFKFSTIDQISPAPYAPIVLYYHNPNGADNLQVHERYTILKQSLSETLTRFYPLAGTIKDDLSMDCNDEGAYYSVARVNQHLHDFLHHQPGLELMHHFLPGEPTRVTNVQVNIFECGGIAIGLCISHRMLDGTSLSTFTKGWAKTACGSEEVVHPDFCTAPSLFPSNGVAIRDSAMAIFGSLVSFGKDVRRRRFVFGSSAIATLKAEATKFNEKCIKRTTRVEVVTSFLWKCAMAATKESYGTKRPSLLTLPVNLRKRAEPILPEYTMGNLFWFAAAECEAGHDDEIGLHELVSRVQKGISEVDSEFVKELQGNQAVDVIGKTLKKIGEVGSKEGVDNFVFSSWCNLGFYEADFGWGKPIWISGNAGPSGLMVKNFIILIETPNGEGIEAWVTMDEQEMHILENDPELLALTSADPSQPEAGNF